MDATDDPNDGRTDATWRGATVVAGVVAWTVLVGVPVWVAQPIALWVPLVLALPLVPLGLGALASQGRTSAFGSDALWWLAVFPAATAAAMLRGRDWVAGDSLSLPTVLLGSASLLVFGAIALSSVTRIRHVDRAKVEALRVVSGDPDALRRLRVRQVLLGLGGVGAFALAVVAPYAAPAHWSGQWGEAGPAASVLTAIVAGGLGVVVLAGFLGPATRKKRDVVPARRRLVRVILALTVAATGTGVWFVMH